ncbi:phospholipase D-like domain-containing protein [Dictyobacter aurantiacus]|uniref:Phospholipase n=1 Tax=Dictyobacter aurantiacus TaxID=1936993 RepID=A0A401ZCR2_9CHLR|nr:phospholipase D family protein [Dictyobacter aurantiacus]GCE04613.1 phospholipase [Dictyobacter aurantiacus]
MRVETDFVTHPGWWSSTDYPVREMQRLAFLIDGRMTMLEMCHRFLSAQKTIYIASWGLSPDLPMVRGKHHRAGEDGSLEQEDLLRWLRDKGLSEADIQFWQKCDTLSVVNVLGYAVSKGVDVRVMLWDALSIPFLAGPRQVREALEAVGVHCLLDDSHMTIKHPIASLHQKAVTIDSRIAFAGGIDLMSEQDGEYDRWDTKGHIYDNLLRIRKNGKLSHGWHDMHLTFEGPAVADVESNFCQRWNDVLKRRDPGFMDLLPAAAPEDMLPPAQVEKIQMQVVRTIPRDTYSFAPDGIATILDIYQNAFARAQRSIYLENQYLWRRTYLGLETPLVSLPTEVMEQLFTSLAEALNRGVSVTMLLPDNPNVGRDFTDDGLKFLWDLAPEAVTSGKLQVYTLASSVQKEEVIYYRPIYIHAKVAIVDDQWVTIGSANLNNRGMRDDAELNVALLHPTMACGLRILLMAEHLGLTHEDTLFRVVETMGQIDPSKQLREMDASLQEEWHRLKQLVGEPEDAMALLARQAQKNLEAVRARQRLSGHIVPYIRHDLAEVYGIEVDAANGWLTHLNDGDIPFEKNNPDDTPEERAAEVPAP